MADYYKILPNTDTEDSCLAPTASDLGTFLKLSEAMKLKQANALEDSIKAAILFAEKNTRREITKKTFELKRDCFGRCGFEIRRAPLIEIVSLQYIDSNETLQTVDPATYYVYESNEFSSVLLAPNESWPTDLSLRKQSVICTFRAGYGCPEGVTEDCGCDIPNDLVMAILAHASALYNNRGDCDCSNSMSVAKFLPPQSKSAYAQYRILLADFT